MSNKGKIKVTERKLVKSNPYKNDVLYTEEGQRKFPGEITKIPSGNISMANINYPVTGIDNLGNQQMMYPEANYYFPGDSVTEYPHLKSGGPSAAKARQMLLDNSAQGHPLTPAQKRYFDMLAHPKHQDGGSSKIFKADTIIDGIPVVKKQLPKDKYGYTPVDWVDSKGEVVISGARYNDPVSNIKPIKKLVKKKLLKVLPKETIQQTTPVQQVAPSTEKPRGQYIYEPNTTNVSGGKGQYVHYDKNGEPHVITKEEYDKNVKKHGGTHFEKRHDGYDYAERLRINEAIMEYGGPTNMNLMKNTFSRKTGGMSNPNSEEIARIKRYPEYYTSVANLAWGGNNASMNDHYSIPSFMQDGGSSSIRTLGITPAFDETNRALYDESVGLYNAAAKQRDAYERMGYRQVPSTKIVPTPTPEQYAQRKDTTKYTNPSIPRIPSSSILPENVSKYRAPAPIPGSGGMIDQALVPSYGLPPSPYPEKRMEMTINSPYPEDQLVLNRKDGGQSFNSPDSNPFENERNNFLKWLKGTSMDAIHEEMIPHAMFHHMPDGSIMSDADMNQEEEQMKKGGSKNWIKGAINPAHKGFCTPMTKSTCTPHRKAFARRAKAHFKQDGGILDNDQYEEYTQIGDMPYEYSGNTNFETYPYIENENDFEDYFEGSEENEQLARGGSRGRRSSRMNYFPRTRSTKGAGLAGMNSYCGGKITEACITAALNDPDPKIRRKAAFAKQMHGVKYQSGGGMNSGTPQDWGYNPSAVNATNYYNAWQQANQQNDLGTAFGNLADVAVNAEMNKQAPSYTGKYTLPEAQEGYQIPGSRVWEAGTDPGKYADVLGYARGTKLAPVREEQDQRPYDTRYDHNLNFGNYGFGYGRGSDWFPMNRFTGHNDYLPSPRHRIKGREENLTAIDPSAYLSKAQLKYGWLNRSSPKEINFDFRRPIYRGPQSFHGFQSQPYDFSKLSEPGTPSGPRATVDEPNPNFITNSDSQVIGNPKYEEEMKRIGIRKYGGYPIAQRGISMVPGFNLPDPNIPDFGYANNPLINTNPLQQQDVFAPKEYEQPSFVPQEPFDTSEEAGTLRMKQKNRYNTEDLANWGLAGMEAATALINQGDVRRKEQALRERTHADQVFASQPQNAGSRGDYDVNSGLFRPDQDVPVQYQGQPGLRRKGGKAPCYNCGGAYQVGGEYQLGGEVFMSDEEIQQYLDAGGELEILD